MPDWPHAPPHRFFEPGTYMVTAATMYKRLFFDTPAKLTLAQNYLLHTLQEFGWQPQAWSVMANHYHVIAYSSEEPETLRAALSKVHSCSARGLNKVDGEKGRKVWYQYWDTHLTRRTSYFARLRYVHENAVHHGLVNEATRYDWCSAGWLEQRADPAYRKMLQSFRIDNVNVYDDF